MVKRIGNPRHLLELQCGSLGLWSWVPLM